MQKVRLNISSKYVSSSYIQPQEYPFNFILQNLSSANPPSPPCSGVLNEPEVVSGIAEKLMSASSQLTDCIHLHAFRRIWKSPLVAELPPFISLDPHLSRAKLTGADSPSPFGLFSVDRSVLADARAEDGKRGEKIVFINVSTVTGHDDQVSFKHT